LLAVVACFVLGDVARADPGLFVGLADDTIKATPAETGAIGRDLGIRAYSVTLRWPKGSSLLDEASAGSLSSALDGAGSARVVVAITGDAGATPTTPQARDQYCSFARDVLARFPQIRDVVVWNEPNLSAFWYPQYGADGSSQAPAMYAALLARCWDVLHAFRPNVNVVAPATSPWGNDDPFGTSNNSHSPTSFLLQLGAAYRASGRSQPIFDTLGHHPYGDSSAERPWRQHTSERTISTGDLNRLASAARDAFDGTGQPTPGRGLKIWYLETGYQTVPDEAKRGLYVGAENWPGPIPDEAGGEPAQPPPSADSPAPDQATQLVDGLRLAYCQPYVEAVFNFQLRDERDLARWQSGVLWADGTRKGSYEAFKRVIAEVNNRAVDCTRMKGTAWTEPERPTSPGAGGSGANGKKSLADRAATRIVWTAPRPVPYGFARLAIRLRSQGRYLPRRTVTFTIGRDTFVTTTTSRGLAWTPIAPPLRPGAHVVTASFRGDPQHKPSGVKVLLRVINSRASVSNQAARRATTSVRNGFHVSSNGRTVEGSLRIRVGNRVIVCRRLTALGISRNGRSAWFEGRVPGGGRLVANALVRGGRADVLRLWLAGRQLRPVRLDLTIVRRKR
jgi:hypothetical protein